MSRIAKVGAGVLGVSLLLGFGIAVAPSAHADPVPNFSQASESFPLTTGATNERTFGHVSCPEGQVPSGGGVSFQTSDTTVRETEEVIESNPSGTGWDGGLRYSSGNLGSSDNLIVYAVCSIIN